MDSKIKVIIVEDEILLAEDIGNRLSRCNCNIIGMATSFNEALDLLNMHPEVDILLIDIVLAGAKDGIQLAEEINKNYQIPFIYLTSHADQSTINRVKKTNPSAYLLKPFNDRQVHIAIELALLNYSYQNSLSNHLEQQETTKNSQSVLKIKDSLFLKKDHHFERVKINDILYLQADNNYCTVHTKTERFIYSIVLKKMEQQLPPHKFMRIHRSYVVNIDCVNGFEGNLLYVGDKKLPVSKSHKEEIFKYFNTI